LPAINGKRRAPFPGGEKKGKKRLAAVKEKGRGKKGGLLPRER